MKRPFVVTGDVAFQDRFTKRMPSLVGVVGTVFMAVFMSISSAIFAPLQCDGHPNGFQTVKNYPQVICWSGSEHTQMVTYGIIASIVPLCFVALCVWVVVQLPARMTKGDTMFLHTFAFLFFRFRPSTYQYVLIVLARNLACALVPTIVDEALQLLSLAGVIGSCVLVSVRLLPWRVTVANALDILTNVGFLVVLFLAALYARVVSESLIADALVAVFSVVCTLFGLVFLGAVHKAILRRGKTFQFFLCHHKQGGGGFTRLLKCRLKQDCRVTRLVFLDADNLQDLNLLFGYVANNVDTLVVICTSEILARPWCVGEMTTARLHGVDTVLVVLPCFPWPTEDFSANYASHVPGILDLAKFGISVEMAQETLLWLRSRSRLLLPQRLTLAVSDAVAGKLVSRKRGLCEHATQLGVESARLASEVEADAHHRSRHIRHLKITSAAHVVQQLEDPPAMPTGEVVAIVDHGNWEGVCTALLVREMLVPHLSTAVERVPYVPTEDDPWPPKTQCALVICTNGCFHSVHFAKQVLEAADRGVHFLPVVAEESFQFPTEAFYEELQRTVLNTLPSQKHRHTNLVTAIGTIFQEIAVDVILQESEDIIAVHVSAIARRLLENRQRTLLNASVEANLNVTAAPEACDLSSF